MKTITKGYIRSDSIRLSVTWVSSYDMHEDTYEIGQQLIAQTLGLDEFIYTKSAFLSQAFGHACARKRKIKSI